MDQPAAASFNELENLEAEFQVGDHSHDLGGDDIINPMEDAAYYQGSFLVEHPEQFREEDQIDGDLIDGTGDAAVAAEAQETGEPVRIEYSDGGDVLELEDTANPAVDGEFELRGEDAAGEADKEGMDFANDDGYVDDLQA